MVVKVNTGCSELALSADVMKVLKFDYVDTVLLSSATSRNAPSSMITTIINQRNSIVYDRKTIASFDLGTPRHGPVLIHC